MAHRSKSLNLAGRCNGPSSKSRSSNDRSRVHVEPHARTLSEHRGLHECRIGRAGGPCSVTHEFRAWRPRSATPSPRRGHCIPSSGAEGWPGPRSPRRRLGSDWEEAGTAWVAGGTDWEAAGTDRNQREPAQRVGRCVGNVMRGPRRGAPPPASSRRRTAR